MAEEENKTESTDENAQPNAFEKLRALKMAGSFKARLKKVTDAISGVFGPMFSGLVSPDLGTRRMSRIFLISCCVAAGSMWAYFFYKPPAPPLERVLDPLEAEKILEREQEKAKKHNSILNVGVYNIELKPIEGKSSAPGILNTAEIEIIVECDSRETCDTMEEQLAVVRDQVSASFAATDREELMSPLGKQAIKAEVRKRLNVWLKKGEIRNVYFIRQTIM